MLVVGGVRAGAAPVRVQRRCVAVTRAQQQGPKPGFVQPLESPAQGYSDPQVRMRRQSSVRKGGKKAIVSIKSTPNNTIVTISTVTGLVVATASGGTVGFKNARKGTPYAAQLAAQQAAEKAMAQGITKVMVYVKGIGAGRETAIRGLAGLEIVLIRDRTGLPHNGCRPPKVRRI